jgi:4'-phosphopantetheinyl transferase
MQILLEHIDKYELKDLLSFSTKKRREESEKFKYDFDKKRYLLGEVILRKILSEKGFDSEQTILYNKHGKPYVDIDNFHFNISHSNNVIILGYSEYGEVGVDIEFMKDRNISFYKNVFHPKEIDYVESYSNRLEAFYKVWTLKESYIKALGVGLSFDLTSFYIIPEGNSNVEGEFKQHRYSNYIISTSEIAKKSKK